MNIVQITMLPEVSVQTFFYRPLNMAVEQFIAEHGHMPETVFVWQGAACPIYYIELAESDHLGKLPLSEDLLTV